MTEPLEEAELFVAATRPAMIMGMPHGLFVVMFLAFTLIIIWGQKPQYELAMVPLWFGARALVRYDYNAFHILSLWLQTKAKSLDGHHWHGASPAPFPLRSPRGYSRGIPNASW